MPRCNVIPRDYVSQDRLESICFGVATYETKRIDKHTEKLLNQNRRCPHAGRLAAHNRHVDETRDAPLLSDWNEARPIRRGGHPNNLANFVSGWLPVQSYGLAIKSRLALSSGRAPSGIETDEHKHTQVHAESKPKLRSAASTSAARFHRRGLLTRWIDFLSRCHRAGAGVNPSRGLL